MPATLYVVLRGCLAWPPFAPVFAIQASQGAARAGFYMHVKGALEQ